MDNVWVTLVTSLISAGILNLLYKAWQAWRADRKASKEKAAPEVKESLHVAQADQSLILVAKARDELVEDLKRIRADRERERVIFAEDRAAWLEEKRQMREEYAALEEQLRRVVAEFRAFRERHVDVDD